MRSAAVVFGLLALGLCETPAFGQAMVEAAGASSAASGSAGALKALGDTIKGTLGGADNTLKATSTTTVVHTSEPATPTRSKSKTGAKNGVAPAAPAAPKPVYEDPQQIQTGISYEDVMHRFGPPAMSWTEESGATKLTYLTKAGPIQLEFADGKVSSVGKPQL
jgi:hypothetical protein